MKFFRKTYFSLLFLVVFSCKRNSPESLAKQQVIDSNAALTKTGDSLLAVYLKEINKPPDFRKGNDKLLDAFLNKKKEHLIICLKDAIEKIERERMWDKKELPTTEVPLYEIEGSQHCETNGYRINYGDRIVTAINRGDSSIILRGFTYSCLGDSIKILKEVTRTITEKQWHALTGKINDSHFWSIEMNEAGDLGGGYLWKIEGVVIPYNNKPSQYHKITTIRPSGPVQDLGKYILQLLGPGLGPLPAPDKEDCHC